MNEPRLGVVRTEVRPGAYFDSIVLMQLQGALQALPGVLDSGAAMATETNLALLRANGLLPEGAAAEARPEDLLIAVKGETEEAAVAALEGLDELLARRRAGTAGKYRPRSLRTAVRALPEASWALVSVPGRHAPRVAEEALDRNLHVFLYSDNVSLAEEARLKRKARAKGLLVMGPDCGTAIVGGVGLGFANRVRRGGIGLIGASGTGLQAISSRVHALGGGISQAIGTGGRDLHVDVGGVTAFQALEILARDPETEVIGVVSKPPSPAVAGRLMSTARQAGKPVVIDFLGYPPPARRIGNLCFAGSLGEAAELAVGLAGRAPAGASERGRPAAGRRYLRGLFSGGTLAQAALLGLRAFLNPLHSNIGLDGVEALADPTQSREHTVVDLGADELTVGRLHPMIDPEHGRRRLAQETADPEVGMILLDVVLGWGAHPDPAGQLAPAIAGAVEQGIAVAAIVIGTDEDPQGLDEQVQRLIEAGATVFRGVGEAVEHVTERLSEAPVSGGAPAVDLESLDRVALINIGLESFYDSLVDQGARAVHMDWRPPAGGDEKLLAILNRMRTQT